VTDRLVVDVSDLPPGGLREVTIGDRAVLLCNAGGSFHAIENRCPHAAPLAKGRLAGHLLECPYHGGTLDVRDGSPQSPPIRKPVATFSVRAVEGGIEIDPGAPGGAGGHACTT
jgi:3-phenylpropionate/trans-cinnamate dioxygenase ferredoxin subunit